MSNDSIDIGTRLIPAIPAIPTSRQLFPPVALLPVVGRVIDVSTELPLAGVLVRWVTQATGGALRRLIDRSFEKAIVLGEAICDQDGAFAITLSQSPQAQQAACGLAWREEAKSYVVVADRTNENASSDAAEPVEVTDAIDDIVLRVSTHVQPDTESWLALANYLASNRMYRAGELTQQLIAPFADSPASAWSAQQRTGALATVSRALDDGNDAAPLPLLEQEHLLNLDALGQGDVVKALNNFRGADQFAQYGGRADEWFGGAFTPISKTDSALYRDYLRGVWVTASRRMHGPGVPDTSLEQQIVTRFHQNFFTADDT
ncbi:MAG TPA: hypothetical protein VGN07_00020, partial [Steroidobacteraceae bacterium]